VREYLHTIFKAESLDKLPAQQGEHDVLPFVPPQTVSLSQFRGLVEQMPDTDNPVSMGLAANIDRALQRVNSQHVNTQLRQVMASVQLSGKSAHVDPRAWESALSPFFSLWDGAERKLAKLKQKPRPPRPDDPPVDAFLLTDASHVDALVSTVGEALRALKKVCAGSGMLTPQLQADALDLLANRTPGRWEAAWPTAPEDPIAFLQELMGRQEALKAQWVPQVERGVSFGAPLCLRDFLRPAVFLNALRQQTARALRVAIDQLHLVTTFDHASLQQRVGQAQCVQVSGLFLEGAKFDDRRSFLVECERSTALLAPLPALSMAWLSRDAHPEATVPGPHGGQVVSIPVYASTTREHLLATAHLHADSARARVLNAAAIVISDQ